MCLVDRSSDAGPPSEERALRSQCLVAKSPTHVALALVITLVGARHALRHALLGVFEPNAFCIAPSKENAQAPNVHCVTHTHANVLE